LDGAIVIFLCNLYVTGPLGNLRVLKVQKRTSFSRIKPPKKLINFASGSFQRRAKRSKKVFWFFFSKKNALFPLTFIALEPAFRSSRPAGIPRSDHTCQ